jgi:hypothetical protein
MFYAGKKSKVRYEKLLFGFEKVEKGNQGTGIWLCNGGSLFFRGAKMQCAFFFLPSLAHMDGGLKWGTW